VRRFASAQGGAIDFLHARGFALRLRTHSGIFAMPIKQQALNYMIKNPLAYPLARVYLVLLFAIPSLSGCFATAPATTPTVQAPAPVLAPAPPAKLPALAEGIALYDKGDYNGAIKHLSGANEIWIADKPVQQEALKYMAFSYCVTGHQALCKQQFEKALALGSSFDLAPGEKGHPLWGPVFDKVKKAK
jgi:hypothetical protein